MGGKFLNKLTIRDVPLDNQTVLVRADYNVPLTKDGKISDDLRIKASLPTIQYLIERGCKIVIISHLGRPDGKDKSLSLEVAADRLAKLLKHDIRFVDDVIGDKVKQAIKRAPKNSITVLENLRFYKQEEANDRDFAKKIADAVGAKYFVQDGFGVVHRAHASTSAITEFMPSVSGLLLEKEYETITSAMENPDKPLIAVMGGAKVSDKIDVIERFIDVVDKIIIGGAMANTFLSHKGYSVGASKVEPGQGEIIDRIYKLASKKVGNDKVDDFIVLPVDLAVATEVSLSAKRKIVGVEDVAANELALDIGNRSIKKISEIVKQAKTVIWNGPLGYAELLSFAVSSSSLAQDLANKSITSIIGGGDTADFILKWDKKKGESFTHVSTGGGASLELMAGEKLPGVESLLDARRQMRYTNSNKHKQ